MKISTPRTITRISFWILVLLLPQLGCKKSIETVTLAERNCRLDVVFKKIELQTGYYFIYREEWLKSADIININVKDEKLNKVLIQCLDNRQLTFSIVGNLIVIKKKIV